PQEGNTSSVLVYFQRAKATVSECAVVGPFGNGVQIADESDIEIRKTLVAAIWHNGIVVAGRGREEADKPSRLHLVESEVRNVYHYGVAIGRGCDTTVVERCRISGSAWHGIRYDYASPAITGNTIFAHAGFGIYASGTTRAKVRGNLFWRNEGAGIVCQIDNFDLIEGNTFAGNLREGLVVFGTKPAVSRNIFASSPVAISCRLTEGRGGEKTTAVGEPVLTANLFHETPVILQVKRENKPAPDGSLTVDPKFRDAAQGDFTIPADSPARAANMGAAEPLAPAGSWPLLAEEKAIIPGDNTRDLRYWTAPGGAKPTKRAENLATQAQAAAKGWIADAFQLDDEKKRLASIESIRAALSGTDPETRKGLAAFLRVGTIEFDKPSFQPALRKLLASPEPDIRAQAAGALSLCGPSPEDAERLIALVDDPSADVRVALPYALKTLSPEGFTGKAGAAILRLLDHKEGKATQAVWHAMWGTKISPELEARVVEASRNDDRGSGYSEVFYHALTVHLSKREPTVTRLIELLASEDTTNVAGRVLWGLQQGVEKDQQARVADAALKVLAARSDGYMRRQALGCVRAYAGREHVDAIKALIAKPNIDSDFKLQLMSAQSSAEARATAR
ncbi:MAG: right-handed parallel beta-helix repeat-containing protein, partial [Verrucomicrobiota bacterium]|nr:right-handed parallel beta-helix repeat-containing protein [Verrucomicrobiota bacterium]